MNKARSLVVAAVLVAPPLAGLVAPFVWFVPNPDMRVYAAVIGGAYLPAIAVAYGVTNRQWARSLYRGVGNTLGSLVGLALFGVASYLAAYISLPALTTALLGREATHVYIVERIDAGTRKARVLCPLSVKLTNANKQGHSVCMDVTFTARPGQWVLFHGKETALGFRFQTYEG